MSKFVPFFKRFSLAALVLAIGLTALPASAASGVVPVSARGAAGLQAETTPPANRPANGVVPVPGRGGVVPVPGRGGVVPVPAYHIVPAGYPESRMGRDNKRLEQIWARAQTAYLRQSDRLAKADEFITNAYSLIDKANQKGWDTSVIQVTLNAFTAIIPTAQAAHNPGAAIIASHNGFNADGKVTDRAVAVETVKALGQVLKDTRLAMNRTGQALREAVKAFRNAHRPAQAPATP